jgi:hypothetical protein
MLEIAETPSRGHRRRSATTTSVRTKIVANEQRGIHRHRHSVRDGIPEVEPTASMADPSAQRQTRLLGIDRSKHYSRLGEKALEIINRAQPIGVPATGKHDADLVPSRMLTTPML